MSDKKISGIGGEIPIWQVFAILVFLMASLLFMLTQIPGASMHGGLLLAAIASGFVGKINGYSWAYMEMGIINSIQGVMKACLILMIVGMLIATWLAGGVIQTMIYYGLLVVSPGIFLAAAFILCSAVSLATGTSWGTAGTMGVALIGIGMALGVPLPMVAGAILSGAYFGDKISPVSDSTLLSAGVLGVDLFQHIKSMLFSTVPAMILSLIAFFILGATLTPVGDASAGDFVAVLTTYYNISPIMLLAPIGFVVVILMKVPAIPAMILGVTFGLIFAVIFQAPVAGAGYDPVTQIAVNLYGGYSPTAIVGALAYLEPGTPAWEAYDAARRLLTRGGMLRMWYSISLVFCAMALGGILDCTNMLTSLCKVIVKFCKGIGSLTVATVITTVGLNAASADQYMSLLLGGKIFKKEYENRRYHGTVCSRVTDGVGTISSAAIPWGTCGVFMATTLGVATVEYIPYMFFFFFVSIICIILGFLDNPKLGMRKSTDEEHADILRKRDLEEQSLRDAVEAQARLEEARKNKEAVKV